MGDFYIGNRIVHFIAYGDSYQKEKESLYNRILNDGTISWGLKGVKKPVIRFNWKVLDNGTDQKLISCRGINGSLGAYVTYLGIDIQIADIDILNTTYIDYNLVVGWYWNGINQLYSCCNIGKLPQGTNQFLGGGGGLGQSNITFAYVNYFEDGNSIVSKFAAHPSQLTLIDNMDNDGIGNTVSETGDVIMDSNGQTFIRRDCIFQNGIELINNPSKAYKNLTTNFEVIFVLGDSE